jgi:hypothetical protein
MRPNFVLSAAVRYEESRSTTTGAPGELGRFKVTKRTRSSSWVPTLPVTQVSCWHGIMSPTIREIRLARRSAST